jgi:hypothetical protein
VFLQSKSLVSLVKLLTKPVGVRSGIVDFEMVESERMTRERGLGVGKLSGPVDSETVHAPDSTANTAAVQQLLPLIQWTAKSEG